MKATRILAAFLALAAIAMSGCGKNRGKFEDMTISDEAFADITQTLDVLNQRFGDPLEKDRTMGFLQLAIKQKKVNEEDIPKLVEALKNVKKNFPSLAHIADNTLQVIADNGYEVEGVAPKEAPAEG